MAARLVTKELKFEAAHRLGQGYPGKCRHNHGHSWIVFVSLGLRDGEALDQHGFVRDFSDFKPLRDWVDEELDHASLVSADDKDYWEWLNGSHQKHFITEGNPTSENLAQIIFQEAVRLLEDDRVYVYEVRIKETCTSEAIYRREA